MDFNKIVFPSPTFNYNSLYCVSKKLIFIPKRTQAKSSSIEYIPCLFIKDKSYSKNILLMFHGNAEDIFGAKNMADSLNENLSLNVLIVEYPGYSLYSSGKEISEEVILENTTVIYDFIKKKFNITDKNIFVFGRSIGTSPAIYLASVRKPNALITISAFTSIKAVAENLVGFLKVLVKERLTSIEYIKNVTCPVLFIHGQSDPLIPFRETILLKDNCDCPYEVFLPEKMTHNDFDIDLEIILPISNFFERHCKIDIDTIDNIDEIIKELNVMPQEIKEFIKRNREDTG